jgi:hypothetical protein
MFFKKKKQTNNESKIILGMVLLSDHEPFNLDQFISDYTTNYEGTIDNIIGDNATASFDVDGEMAAIGHMPVPVPNGDITSTAEYAYNWETAVEDLQAHQSHLIVSVMGKGPDQLKRYKIFTRVICSLMRTTHSIGVFKGTQTLLIPKDNYLEEAALMSDDYLPLNLWIYFGLRITNNGQCGYTFGLREFNKNEMEVLDSSQSLEDIRAFLFNMAHYVLDFDVTFKDGQTCGLSAEEKIKITFSKGKLVEGQTYKLAY